MRYKQEQLHTNLLYTEKNKFRVEKQDYSQRCLLYIQTQKILVLVISESRKLYILKTNASNFTIEGALFQKQKDQ